MTGSYSSMLGDNASLRFREKMKNSNLSALSKDIAKAINSNIKISNVSIDSLHQYDQPVTIRYELKMDFETDIIYFNPMFGEGVLKNPFSSSKRNYPVEMPYLKNDTYMLNMAIPEGFEVEEMPKSVRYKLNEKDGFFEYLIVKENGWIQIRSKIVFKRANFDMEDYDTLREFYAYIIKQQSGQIVLKKSRNNLCDLFFLDGFF